MTNGQENVFVEFPIDFSVAYDILYLGAKNEFEGIKTRDYIFNWTLNEFCPNPVKIFQVGAIETFKMHWRIGSGWSDLIFGEYIKKYGGNLTIADINLDHLSHSAMASTSLKYPITMHYGDALNSISQEDHDIYYLDGSNDPQETLDQFNKIKHKRCIVLVDDFSIKGTLLTEAGYNFEVRDVANGVGILDLREKLELYE